MVSNAYIISGIEIKEIDLDHLLENEHITQLTKDYCIIEGHYKGGGYRYKAYYSYDLACQKLSNTNEEYKINRLLSNDRFDSKDWKTGNKAEKIEWLLSMYESKKEEAETYIDMLSRDSHDNDCPWKNFHQSLKNEKQDEYLSIEEGMVHYNPSIVNHNKPIKTFIFNYCPICGCKL